MAVTKTITANGSKGHHTFTLRVNEDSTSNNSSFMSYLFTIAPIQSGWDWYNWGSQISYNISIDSNTYVGTIPNYNGSSTITLSSGSNIEIPHNSDGTKTINISFSVSDSTGQSYTCGSASSSSTLKLTDLHKAPEITNATISSEANTKLTNISVPVETIVQYLSNKTFTISAPTYDSATITNYSIYHNNVLIGTSTTNSISINFANVGELQTTLSSGTNYVGLVIAVTDNKGGYTTRAFNYPVIKYTMPTIELTSTTIKRKTSSGTSLTDNKVLLNFVGTCYKGNDVVGNANTPKVQYKLYVRNSTEPDYTNLTTPSTSNVTITDYEINNIIYTQSYLYKIKFTDTFIQDDTSVKAGLVPTGISIMSEYKDRVNFIEATIQNKKYLSNIGDCIKVIKNATQNITQNSFEQVTFENVEYNTSTKLSLSNNAIYIGENVSTILVIAQWNAWSSSSSLRYAYIRKNRTEVTFTSSSYASTLKSQIVLPVEEGDYIELFCYTEQSGTTTITSGNTHTFMQVTILG